MITNNFFLKWNNHFNNNGTFKGECVNVIKSYFKEVLGLPIFTGNAIDYWTNSPQGFQKIKKTIFNKPLPEDIIIWNYKPNGHIGICAWSRSFDFGCFEQNDPIGSPCHFKTYNYKNVVGWLRPIPAPALPKSPLEIAWIGSNLPQVESFQSEVSKYSSGKISVNVVQYQEDIITPDAGMLTQDDAYQICDLFNPKEKFIFIFYPPNVTSSFYATYYYPKRDCIITTCPGNDPRLLAFEMSHQLQTNFNTHRGNNPPVEIVDSNFPNDTLIKSKYDSVSKYYANI